MTDQSRPHTLAGSFALQFPNDWKDGTTLSWLENAGAFGTFRFASGTAFTRCPNESGNEFVFSGQVCSRQFEGDINGAPLPMLKQFDLRVTKGFVLGGTDVTTYAFIRNLFNFTNTTAVFAVTNDINNGAAFGEQLAEDLNRFGEEAAANGAQSANGDITLPSANGGCTDWVLQNLVSAASPNCMFLIRAEQRYGNGDRTFSVEEQTAASRANYDRQYGQSFFTGPGRDVRLGVELSF